MAWIVIGEEKNKVQLVSKTKSNELPGILPKGSFLTVLGRDKSPRFVLRVDESSQHEVFRPSPLIVDMDLEGLYGENRCQNHLEAYRIKNLVKRSDGKIDFIEPRLIARRSNQEEVNIALTGETSTNIQGPRVFLATLQGGENQHIADEDGHFLTSIFPEDMFYHQIQITGKTGSGKTVAIKYLAQYFVDELKGAVLAVNVKDIDLLTMNRPSQSKSNKMIEKEWEELNDSPRGVGSTVIYYPANTSLSSTHGIDHSLTTKITLDVQKLDPESLTGLLQNISDIGVQNLPDIFRFWQSNHGSKKFKDFTDYFNNAQNNSYEFDTQNIRGDRSHIKLHSGTYGNIQRSLNSAAEFFDNEGAKVLNGMDILSRGHLSVINVTGNKGVQFGSILLRDLLHKIVELKSTGQSDVPILVIIDEVHQFYNTDNSREALSDLDRICRTGRSQKIGVIFASQNEGDIPKGLSSVINTKILFRTDISSSKYLGVASEEIQSLSPGFAIVSVHGNPQLRIVKFPMSLAGVNDGK